MESHVACTYLVVVSASEEALYHYLRARFEADAGTQVILDRRRRDLPAGGPLGERRASRSRELLSSQRVAVIRLTAAAGEGYATNHEPAGKEVITSMESIEDLESRQRVDRWLEESQYLIGRLVPAYLEDRDRLRGRLEVVEQDNDRLRTELAEARREIAELRGDLEFHRTERTSVVETFSALVEHLAALQKPVNDISRRLQAMPQSPSEVRV
ncbi:MAG TPA: hypothetical protein VFV05_00660 [Methylomirabilota bacterium]|nr:hypothetical protein [Methylomirabilota bacterium]